MEQTEALKKKRLLIGIIVYAAIFLLLVLVTNLTPFNRWLNSVIRLLRPVLIGLILAYLCNPFFRFFERKLFYKIQPHGLRRCISLIFTYLTLLLIIGVLVLLIVPQLVDSILNFMKNSEAYLNNAMVDINNLITTLNERLPQDADGKGLIPYLNPQAIKEGFAQILRSIKIDGKMLMELLNADTIDTIIGVASDIMGIITDLIFGLFISLYLLNTKEKRYAQIMRMRRALFSDNVNAHITKICTTADRSFGGFLKGKILDSCMVGVLVYIAISLCGVPYSILIAVIVAITDIIPVIGPFIGVIPSAVIILLTEPTKVIPFVLCILIIQQIDGNILAPKILGENTGVSSLCVMISITTLGSLWGLAGMILGVPLFATVLELTSDFLDRRLKKKGLSTDTEDYYTPGLADSQKEEEGNVFARMQKKKSLRRAANTSGGTGDLTTFERFRLDTYTLAQKHRLFSEESDEILAGFATEEAGLTASAEEQIAAEEETEQQTETTEQK